MWSWTFAAVRLTRKPKNVSFLFEAAGEFVRQIHNDVALFCTHSDVAGMRQVAQKFSPLVIDVYTEVVEPHWNTLRNLRRSNFADSELL